MPLIQVNADADTPRLRGGGDLTACLARELAPIPDAAPVVILIHGYKFSPYNPVTSPHRHILSLRPRPGSRKAISWPRHLGFGRGAADEGLCIAFGWEARGTIWSAWSEAEHAAAALADIVIRLCRLRPGPVDVLGHSLGARVALGAMSHLPPYCLGRVLLMAAAEFQAGARRALATPGARGAEVINVTTRENDLFDLLVECLIRAPAPRNRALGAGLPQAPSNWLDVQIDHPDTRTVLADFGYRIPPPARRVCHWSAYLRPGMFRFYRDLIRQRHELPLECLARALPDCGLPRFFRLLPAPAQRRLLPLASKASL